MVDKWPKRQLVSPSCRAMLALPGRNSCGSVASRNMTHLAPVLHAGAFFFGRMR